MDDHEETDGCALDFGDDDDETSELRALFPDGDPKTADMWKELFK